MRSFASDNNSGVHPLVMDALIKANKDHTVGYGDDPWSKAAEQLIKEHFGEGATPFLVFNGTGANSVALQAVTRPFNSIICAATAHIFVDECGAPAKMSGCPLIPVNTPDGKLTPELIKPYLKDFGVCHHSQPGAVYISQATELGTLYTPEEVERLADFILLRTHSPYGWCAAGKCMRGSGLHLQEDDGRCRSGYPQLWRHEEWYDDGEAVIEISAGNLCQSQVLSQAIGTTGLQAPLSGCPVSALSG